jgi:hypothetical protein
MNEPCVLLLFRSAVIPIFVFMIMKCDKRGFGCEKCEPGWKSFLATHPTIGRVCTVVWRQKKAREVLHLARMGIKVKLREIDCTF